MELQIQANFLSGGTSILKREVEPLHLADYSKTECNFAPVYFESNSCDKMVLHLSMSLAEAIELRDQLDEFIMDSNDLADPFLPIGPK